MTTRLTLLHTNDLHGSVEGLSKAATLARAIRAECEREGRTCLWLDAGDVEEWTVLASAASRGAALWALLHVAGVDQATVGNGLLLTYGAGAMPGAAAAFGKPILLASLTELATDQPSPATTPFVIYDVGGLKIGIIGLSVAIREYAALGFAVADPALVLQQWLPRMREAGAEVIIALSHCGSGRDQELAQRFGAENVALFISAHDHEIYEQPIRANGAYIAETGHRGFYLGRIDMELAPGRIVALNGSLLPLREDVAVASDPAVDLAWEQQLANQQKGLDETVATLLQPAPLTYDRESAMGDLLADALRARVDAEIGIVIPGHLRDGLKAGPVTRGEMLRVLGSPTHPVCARLTGQQIRNLLEIRCDPVRMNRKPLPLRNKPEGLPSVSGLKMTLDLNAPARERVVDLRLENGAALDPARVYTVGSTYYEMHFGFQDLLGPPTPPDLAMVGGPIGATLSDYLAAHSPLTPPPGDRVTLL